MHRFDGLTRYIRSHSHHFRVLAPYAPAAAIFILAFMAIAPHAALAQVGVLQPGFSIFPASCNCGGGVFGTTAGVSTGAGWGCALLVFQNIITFIIYLAVLGCVVAIAYAGFLWVTNPANPSNRERGRTVMLDAVIGLVIVLAAWLIVNTLFTVLTTTTLTAATAQLGTGAGNCLPTATDQTGTAQGTSAGLSPGQTPGSSGGCPGALICTSGGTCGPDPSLDPGAPGTPSAGTQGANCTSSSQCTSPLVCDNTDQCDTVATNPTPVPSSCTSTPAGSGTTGSGTCAVQTSGPCASSNFTAFGGQTQQNQMSAICDHETSNGANTTSGVDLALPSRQSISFGLFQINITANNVVSDMCPAAFSCPNGASPCAYTGSNHTMNITNPSLYQQCKSDALGSPGVAEALILFQAQRLGPWVADTNACPNISSGT